MLIRVRVMLIRVRVRAQKNSDTKSSTMLNSNQNSILGVLFQIELAHWFYEDFILEEYKSLKGANQQSLKVKLQSFTLKQFSLLLFKSCILLRCVAFISCPDSLVATGSLNMKKVSSRVSSSSTRMYII